MGTRGPPTSSTILTYRRTSYDIERAQNKIREAGLPPFLADRLAIGR